MIRWRIAFGTTGAWLALVCLALGMAGSVSGCGGGERRHKVLAGGQPVELGEAELVERMRGGTVTDTTQVWVEGSWRMIRDVSALASILQTARAPREATPPVSAPPDASRGQSAGLVRIAMEYVADGFPMGLSTQNGRGSSLAELPDESFRVMPDRTGERLFGTLDIGDRPLQVLLELGGGGRPPRLYLDLNGDGDLTNDPGPFTPERDQAIPAHYTIRLPWQDETSSEALQYRMWWFPSNMGGTSFYAACYRRGRFPYGDVPMVLFDTNADGDYSNDPLYIDWNRNDKAEPNEAYLRGEPIPVGTGTVRCELISRGGAQVGFAS